jgi:hypothetical protein
MAEPESIAQETAHPPKQDRFANHRREGRKPNPQNNIGAGDGLTPSHNDQTTDRPAGNDDDTPVQGTPRVEPR